MKKLNNAVLTVQNKTRNFAEKAMEKAMTKRAGDSGTVAALILIVIVVGILITFKTAITGWVSTLIGYFNGALNNFTL